MTDRYWGAAWHESFTGAWHDLIGDEATCRRQYADAVWFGCPAELTDPAGVVVARVGAT